MISCACVDRMMKEKIKDEEEEGREEGGGRGEGG